MLGSLAHVRVAERLGVRRALLRRSEPSVGLHGLPELDILGRILFGQLLLQSRPPLRRRQHVVEVEMDAHAYQLAEFGARERTIPVGVKHRKARVDLLHRRVAPLCEQRNRR